MQSLFFVKILMPDHMIGLMNTTDMTYDLFSFKNSCLEVFFQKVLLKDSSNLLEITSARDSFLIKLQAEACNFIKKDTLVQVFSCEFHEIFKNTFFVEHFWTATSVHC